MAQCNISNVIVDASDCDESFSGTGTRMYVGLVNDLEDKPTINDLENSKAAFKAECFASLEGKLACYDIKEESGEATYETNPDGGGFNNKYEFKVAKNMDKFSHEMRTLNNQKFLAFVPDGKGGYYVYYSAMGSAKIDSGTGTTGKAASDEHGHTITISASPMYYPLMKWYPVVTSGSGETATSTPVDLDDWCATNPTTGEAYSAE